MAFIAQAPTMVWTSFYHATAIIEEEITMHQSIANELISEHA